VADVLRRTCSGQLTIPQFPSMPEFPRLTLSSTPAPGLDAPSTRTSDYDRLRDLAQRIADALDDPASTVSILEVLEDLEDEGWWLESPGST
jgi:hypothetical protein